jgi:hypothetical protein
MDIRVHHHSQAHVSQIAETVGPFSSLLGFRYRWQEHRRQDGNDGNDYEEFDQRKTPAAQVLSANQIPDSDC